MSVTLSKGFKLRNLKSLAIAHFYFTFFDIKY